MHVTYILKRLKTLNPSAFNFTDNIVIFDKIVNEKKKNKARLYLLKTDGNGKVASFSKLCCTWVSLKR